MQKVLIVVRAKCKLSPGVFQGRVYCSVNSISFQRSAFLKIFKCQEYTSFSHAHVIRLRATHPTVAHALVGKPGTTAQQGDDSQRSFFETQKLRLLLLRNSSPGNLIDLEKTAASHFILQPSYLSFKTLIKI